VNQGWKEHVTSEMQLCWRYAVIIEDTDTLPSLITKKTALSRVPEGKKILLKEFTFSYFYLAPES
jgi:hypothetical protein